MAAEHAALLEFCETDYQRKVINAIVAAGSVRKGAKAIDSRERPIYEVLKRVKNHAARRGHSPDHDMTRTVPEGFHLKGVSTYYDKDGKPTGQWVKSSIDHERQREMMLEAVAALSESIPRATPLPAPKNLSPELCTVYTLTDCHVGMRAWGVETLGDNWDLPEAERVLTAAFSAMIKSSPDAETCVIAQLGDWMHYDSLDAVTPTNRHLLDADGRFGKVVQVAIRILRTVIDQALLKHKTVVLLIAEGNHDLSSAVWLRGMFSALYEREKRLLVINSELPYYVYQHGKTMLAWHHGHLKGNAALPLLFAAQFHDLWGSTTKRYCHTGHRHHLEMKEHPGMLVVQHATIAARDAYAARGGWIADRQIRAISYHREYGEVSTVVITPEMLK